MERVRGRFVILALLALAAAAAPAQAAFPGRNGLLAYYQDDIGAVAPHGIAVLGGTPTDIGPTCQEGEPAPCPANPTWSPDGQTIAFDLGGDLARMRFDGSALQVIDVPGVKAARPAWSPDGAKLVFEGLPAGARRRSLYVMNAAGGGVHRLAAGRQPAWSVKDRIAFARDKDLYVIRPDGRGLKRLTRRGGGQPNWSPDGRQIAFNRKNRVWRLNVANRRSRRLTRVNGAEPAWTPDGRWILFVNDEFSNLVIERVRPNGKGRKLVTSGEEGRRDAVSDPDQQPL